MPTYREYLDSMTQAKYSFPGGRLSWLNSYNDDVVPLSDQEMEEAKLRNHWSMSGHTRGPWMVLENIGAFDGLRPNSQPWYIFTHPWRAVNVLSDGDHVYVLPYAQDHAAMAAIDHSGYDFVIHELHSHYVSTPFNTWVDDHPDRFEYMLRPRTPPTEDELLRLFPQVVEPEPLDQPGQGVFMSPDSAPVLHRPTIQRYGCTYGMLPVRPGQVVRVEYNQTGSTHTNSSARIPAGPVDVMAVYPRWYTDDERRTYRYIPASYCSSNMPDKVWPLDLSASPGNDLLYLVPIAYAPRSRRIDWG